ncbi:hypothetical protein M8C21_017895 [Ambrosia artemisiifolia]|uniref:Uncharacterized protein n=1 Tax=Ambrosia artemisiifolia TaxID=4212 RepID=A0AAD5C543_AMBAR|nr:hypothetical protein M8C21_017895 [Ambrosia artemisiifolia]
MGNCHTAEATAVVMVVHPGYKLETIYQSVTAGDVMDANPGHYVGQLVKSPEIKYLKLLRTNDRLLAGQVYRLISYEDVLKEFAAKKCVKLGKLLMERGVIEPVKETVVATVPVVKIGSSKNGSRRKNGGRKLVDESHFGGQWKPALKTISEIGN